MSDEPLYVVWSNEHGGWWGPGRHGYVKELHQAGLYSRTAALDICTGAIPGHMAATGGVLPEIPVRLDDLKEMRERHNATYPGRAAEPWE